MYPALYGNTQCSTRNTQHADQWRFDQRRCLSAPAVCLPGATLFLSLFHRRSHAAEHHALLHRQSESVEPQEGSATAAPQNRQHRPVAGCHPHRQHHRPHGRRHRRRLQGHCRFWQRLVWRFLGGDDPAHPLPDGDRAENPGRGLLAPVCRLCNCLCKPAHQEHVPVDHRFRKADQGDFRRQETARLQPRRIRRHGQRRHGTGDDQRTRIQDHPQPVPVQVG